jgi:diacylglycerol O-acyltransferase / wax synthase
MTSGDVLTPLDASFLYMESPQTPMHMGSIGIFEGAPLHDTHGCLRLLEVRAEVGSRLHLVPKLRKRLRLPLFGEPAPVWVDDPEFDIANHVHQAALPEPGDDAQLLAFCAGRMSFPLDRSRPLWDMWLIDGLQGGRVALFEMLHHAMADGLAGVELATVLLDLEPHPPGPHNPDSWEPVPGPPRLAVAEDGLERLGGQVWRVLADGWRALRHPSRAGHVMAHYISAFASLFAEPVTTPACSLNTRVGFDRRAVIVRQPLDALHGAEHHFGVTLNDLLLTAIARGVHDLLSARAEVTEGRNVSVLIPVGSDHHGDHGLGNEVSAMVVHVPIGAAPASERLRAVADAERSAKIHDQAMATHFLLSSLDAWPPVALSAASHLVHHQPLVNLVVTNVPGPDVPLYILGARMIEAIPLVPLGGNLSVGVAALSYDGQLSIGILADPVACPDVEALAEGIGRCFGELMAEAGSAPPCERARGVCG